MPTLLLPENLAAQLKDPTCALAAAFIIANRHPEILSFVSKTISSALDHPGASGHGRPQGNGCARKSRAGADRSSKRDLDDQALLVAMEGGGTIGEWAESIAKSKSSIVTALGRLRDAGLVCNSNRKWALVEAAPREPPPRWVAPLPSSHRASHAHLNAAS